MYVQTPRHPRAGVAVGLAVLAVWLAAFAIALATDDPPDRGPGVAPATAAHEAPSAEPLPAAP
jgi:hypothetical protein